MKEKSSKISEQIFFKKTSSFLKHYEENFAQLVFWRECYYEGCTYDLCEIKIIPCKYAKEIEEDLKIVENFK